MWYKNFIRQLMIDPNSLSSIVDYNSSLVGDYTHIKLCYEDIMFDLDQDISDGSKYWRTVSEPQCHIISFDQL